MDTTGIATSFGARLPGWVLAELAHAPAVLGTDEDRMRLVHVLAERNHRAFLAGYDALGVLRPTIEP